MCLEGSLKGLACQSRPAAHVLGWRHTHKLTDACGGLEWVNVQMNSQLTKVDKCLLGFKGEVGVHLDEYLVPYPSRCYMHCSLYDNAHQCCFRVVYEVLL